MSKELINGPWQQGTKGPNGCPIIGNGKGVMICQVAHSVNHEDQRETAESHANLIAAAPDLLEQVIFVSDYLTAIHEGLPDSAVDVILRLNDVINEATGKEPS